MKKIILNVAGALVLIALGSCAVLSVVGEAIESVGRGLVTGSAAVLLGAIGWLFGPLGAAIGVLVGGCVAYLFEERSAIEDFAQKGEAAQKKAEIHREVVHEASGLVWQLILLGVLVGMAVLYFRHKDVRQRVNSVARSAWGTFRGWLGALRRGKAAGRELQPTDPGRKADAGT